MSTDYTRLRSAVFDHLRHASADQFSPRGLISILESPTDSDLLALQQIIHELYVGGIIVPGPAIRSNTMMSAQFMQWPFYQVTLYGRTVLAETEYVPHDPDAYIEQLKSEISELDEVIVRYLEQALGCFRINYLLASAVMLGCAAEKAMLLLIEAFPHTIVNSSDRQKYEKEIQKQWMISRKYSTFWKKLAPMASSLPNNLGDDLHTILDRIFDLIRTTRNEAGHPTGRNIDKQTMQANFLLFPTYCKRAYGLIRHWTT